MVDGVSANIGIAAARHLPGNGFGGVARFLQRPGRNEQPGLRGCHAGIPNSDLDLCSGVRPHAGRPDFDCHALRHESVSRNRVRLLAKRCARRQQLVQRLHQQSAITKSQKSGKMISAGRFSGPILKDRTFFFFSYEGLRLRLPADAADDRSRPCRAAERGRRQCSPT